MWPKSNFTTPAVAAVGFWLIGGISPAAADVLHVPGDFPTIQEGIDAAVDGDEVIVTDGVYTGVGNTNLDFGGRLITVRSESGDPALCIIDCQGVFGVRGFYFHSGETDQAVVMGFTIRNGNPDEDGGGMLNVNSNPTVINCTFSLNSAWGNGGGMYNDFSNPTVINCTFSLNSVFSGHGGGMCNSGSNPIVKNCAFVANSTEEGGFTGSGGGMANINGSSPTITNCTFSANCVDSYKDSTYGGGMFNTDGSSPTVTDCTFSANTSDLGGGVANRLNSSPTVTNCTFSGNRGFIYGGGMLSQGGAATVTDCTFIGNIYGGGMFNIVSSPTVTDCTFIGNAEYGGMSNGGGSPTVTNCTFTGNSSDNSGGGMANFTISNPTVTNCTFSGNSAEYWGGGMFNLSSNATVTNCTFSRNSAGTFDNELGGWGGGMSNIGDSSPTITNCTFSGNVVQGKSASGGGIYSQDSSSPTVINCILWGDVLDEISGAATVRYSDVAGGFAGVGNIDADPMFVDPENDDYHLSPGSPSIDAGNNWGVPVDANDYDEDGVFCELFPVDLDGNPRFNADEADFDPGCGVAVVVDMGAYEYQFDPADQVTFADQNGDGAVGAADLLGLLASWGPCAKGCCLADLDIDGSVGASDLLALLAHWGPCP